MKSKANAEIRVNTVPTIQRTVVVEYVVAPFQDSMEMTGLRVNQIHLK